MTLTTLASLISVGWLRATPTPTHATTAPPPSVPKRPCLEPGCPNLSPSGRCELHIRDKNLARDLLPTIYTRDKGICYLCQKRVPQGSRLILGPESPSLHHLDGTSDSEGNLVLTHLRCNQQAG